MLKPAIFLYFFPFGGSELMESVDLSPESTSLAVLLPERFRAMLRLRRSAINLEVSAESLPQEQIVEATL